MKGLKPKVAKSLFAAIDGKTMNYSGVFLFIIILNLFYNFSEARSLNNKKHHHIKRINIVMDIFFLLTVIASLIIISRVGLLNLFARSTNSLDIENQSVWLIVNYSLRSIPVIFAALNILYHQKKESFISL